MIVPGDTLGGFLSRLVTNRGSGAAMKDKSFIAEAIYCLDNQEVVVKGLMKVGEIANAIEGRGLSNSCWRWSGGYTDKDDKFVRVEVKVDATKTARLLADALMAKGYSVRQIASALEFADIHTDIDRNVVGIAEHGVTKFTLNQTDTDRNVVGIADHGVTKVTLNQQDIFVE